MLTLAFDTATQQATSALVDDGIVLGERISTARLLLLDIDALLRDAGRSRSDIDRIVVGTGPGSFTGTRIGIAAARGIALGLGIPAAGVSTLDALAASGFVPVVDARRGQVFVLGPHVVGPDELDLPPGTTCVGDGALRYRDALGEAGIDVLPNDDPRHTPHAAAHARLAESFGPVDEIDAIYVRAPDAIERTR